VNFVVKKSPKAQEEIVHIDRLTKYKNTVPPQWRKEVERERNEQGKNDARETGLASAPREHGETDLKKRSRTDSSPLRTIWKVSMSRVRKHPGVLRQPITMSFCQQIFRTRMVDNR